MVCTRINTPCWLGSIQIAKLEIECPRGFDDLLHWRIGWLVHTALVTGEMEHTRRPRTPSTHFGAPHDLVGVTAGEADIRDIKRTLDAPGVNFLPKKPVHKVCIDRKVLDPRIGYHGPGDRLQSRAQFPCPCGEDDVSTLFRTGNLVGF